MFSFLSISERLMKVILPACLLCLSQMTASGQSPAANRVLMADDAGPQVKVHLRVIEVSQTKLERLGFDFEKIIASPNGKPATVEKGDRPFSKSGILEENSVASRLLDVLCKDKLAKVIVNSTLMPPSGKTVAYNLGIEPAARPKKDAAVPAALQPGIQMKLKTDVLDEKTVRLELSYHESQPDAAKPGTAANKALPGVHVRDMHTAVEMKSGQIFLIAGPSQVRTESQNEGVPLISEVPYLGALFRTVKEVRNEVRLLIVVRPEIVPPRAAAAGRRTGEGNVQR